MGGSSWKKYMQWLALRSSLLRWNNQIKLKTKIQHKSPFLKISPSPLHFPRFSYKQSGINQLKANIQGLIETTVLPWISLQNEKYNSRSKSRSTSFYLFQVLSYCSQNICTYWVLEFPIVRKQLIMINLRLMIIDKYIPKLLGENLHFLFLSLKAINLIMSLKCKHNPHPMRLGPG